VALKAIQHKKHVLIEKPMALTQKEVVQITNAAKDNKVLGDGRLYVRVSPSV
jgi:xylose dehydrogenase (NAD/NADP)